MGAFAPAAHPWTVSWWKLEAWIPITRVTSMHIKEVVVWTSTVFVIVIAYSSIAAGVFVERSAEAAFLGNSWARTPWEVFVRLLIFVIGHNLDSTEGGGGG